MAEDSIKRLATKHPRLLAFELTGRISQDDVEWMADVIRPYFSADRSINILLILRRYKGLDAGAVFDMKSVTTQIRSARYVAKYAVVGAPTWIETIINLFDPISPVEARTFASEDEEAAWAWAEQLNRSSGNSRPNVGCWSAHRLP